MQICPKTSRLCAPLSDADRIRAFEMILLAELQRWAEHRAM
jgi:hypothetical protein